LGYNRHIGELLFVNSPSLLKTRTVCRAVSKLGLFCLQVVELDLQGNNFGERISPKAFVGVGERLLALNLAWSNVTRLSSKVFRGLKAVRNMSLAENHLRRLPSTIFDDLRSVERLTLAGNSEINDLPRRLFRNQHASLQVDSASVSCQKV